MINRDYPLGCGQVNKHIIHGLCVHAHPCMKHGGEIPLSINSK